MDSTTTEEKWGPTYGDFNQCIEFGVSRLIIRETIMAIVRGFRSRFISIPSCLDYPVGTLDRVVELTKNANTVEEIPHIPEVLGPIFWTMLNMGVLVVYQRSDHDGVATFKIDLRNFKNSRFTFSVNSDGVVEDEYRVLLGGF